MVANGSDGSLVSSGYGTYEGRSDGPLFFADAQGFPDELEAILRRPVMN